MLISSDRFFTDSTKDYIKQKRQYYKNSESTKHVRTCWRHIELTDLSILLPCKRTLVFHLTRANYVAKLWKSSGILENEPSFEPIRCYIGGEELFNLGSGQQFRGDITELLNIWQHGKVDPQFNFKPAHLLRRKEVSRYYSPSKASFIL